VAAQGAVRSVAHTCTVLSHPAETMMLSSFGSNLSEKIRFEWPGVTPATPPASVAIHSARAFVVYSNARLFPGSGKGKAARKR